MKNSEIMYSCDSIGMESLNYLRMNKGLYDKIHTFLKSFGDFGDRICFQVYQISNNKDNEFIKLWCEDINENIFIICSKSCNSNDLRIVEKIDNNGHVKYNLSLVKKESPTVELGNLMKFDEIYDFKFGRLVTDRKTFFNVLLRDNMVYCVNISGLEGPLSIDELLSRLNGFENMFSLSKYSNLINEIIVMNNFNYNSVDISAYSNFELTYSYTYEKENESRTRKPNNS